MLWKGFMIYGLMKKDQHKTHTESEYVIYILPILKVVIMALHLWKQSW